MGAGSSARSKKASDKNASTIAGSYPTANHDSWKGSPVPPATYKAYNVQENGEWYCEGHRNYCGHLHPTQDPDVYEGPYSDDGKPYGKAGHMRWTVLDNGTIQIDHHHKSWGGETASLSHPGRCRYFVAHDVASILSKELIGSEWNAGKSDHGPEAYAANPWAFHENRTFVTLRDGCNGTWSCRNKDGVAVLRMQWVAGQHGNWAEFAAQPSGANPRLKCIGSSYGFMCSWSIQRKADNGVPSDTRLILVKRDSCQRCIFEHADGLRKVNKTSSRAGVPLSLRSHPGLGVVAMYPNARQAHIWSYIELGIGKSEDALNVSYDGTFIARACDGMVFDIAHWKHDEGNHLCMLHGPDERQTRSGGGGRDFVINDEGSISPKHAPHLALGIPGEVGAHLRLAASLPAHVPEEILAWLATYEAQGGPRPDQRGAFAWFEGNGWKANWPLQYAAMVGDSASIHKLVAEGHDPNVKMTDWFDSEPLGWAASFGQLAALISLIQEGADPSRPPNKSGNTPRSDAERERHHHIIRFLDDYDKRMKACVSPPSKNISKQETKPTHEELEHIPLPAYWVNLGSGHALHACDGSLVSKFQEMFDGTWRGVATRDRTGGRKGLKRLVVVQVLRNESSRIWRAYKQKLDQITAAVGVLDPTKRVEFKTTDVLKDLESSNDKAIGWKCDANPVLNEAFLFHGTNPESALNICQNDFRIDLAGSSRGTLYGRGVYFAEMCTKSDEYAEDDKDGIYKGLYCILLCRVTLGKCLYTDEVSPDPERLTKACTGSGAEYNSVLGDREKARGTYREFVIYDNDQVYPEFVIIYRREDGAAPSGAEDPAACKSEHEIDGLKDLLERAKLTEYADAATDWLLEMGAKSVQEVVDDEELLCEFEGHLGLKKLEVRRLRAARDQK